MIRGCSPSQGASMYDSTTPRKFVSVKLCRFQNRGFILCKSPVKENCTELFSGVEFVDSESQLWIGLERSALTSDCGRFKRDLKTK